MPFKCLITEQTADRNEEKKRKVVSEDQLHEENETNMTIFTDCVAFTKTTVAYKCSP